jgi:Diacylglycerol acyltransferase
VSIVLITHLHVRVSWPIAVFLWLHATHLSPYAASLAECGNPHAGCRQWNGFRRWITANIDEALTAWFGRVEVVRDGKTKFDPQRRYMFGYAPHGLFPIGMQLSLCSSCLCHSPICGLVILVDQQHADTQVHNTGVGYLPLMPAWRVALPGVNPVSSPSDEKPPRGGKHHHAFIPLQFQMSST